MTRFLAPALFVLSTLPAAAQDGANGLSTSGEAKLEYVDASSSVLAFAGDAGLSWRSGGMLGFDASVDTVNTDDGSNFTNVWGALVLSMGSSEIAVGAPRPVLDTMRVAPRFSSSRLLDLELSILKGSMTGLASTSDNGMTPGVTYKYTSGSLSFGAGFHRLDDDGIDSYEGIMRYDGSAASLFVSAERLDSSSGNMTILQIGALRDGDRFDAGATLSKLRSSGTANSLRVYGSFDVMPSLTVRGDALLVQHSDDIYSLSATYRMDSGLFIEGGASTTGGSNDIYDIGVGFKF